MPVEAVRLLTGLVQEHAIWVRTVLAPKVARAVLGRAVSGPQVLAVVHRPINGGNTSRSIFFAGKCHVYAHTWVAISVHALVHDNFLDFAVLPEKLVPAQHRLELVGGDIRIESDHVDQVFLDNSHAREVLLVAEIVMMLVLQLLALALLALSLFALLALLLALQVLLSELLVLYARIVVRPPARGTPVILLGTRADAVVAELADLEPARTRLEVLIRDVHVLDAQRALLLVIVVAAAVVERRHFFW